MEGFTFVEKSVKVCGSFTVVGGFTFDGVTDPFHGSLSNVLKCNKDILSRKRLNKQKL